jgi:hypothetical protein
MLGSKERLGLMRAAVRRAGGSEVF